MQMPKMPETKDEAEKLLRDWGTKDHFTWRLEELVDQFELDTCVAMFAIKEGAEDRFAPDAVTERHVVIEEAAEQMVSASEQLLRGIADNKRYWRAVGLVGGRTAALHIMYPDGLSGAARAGEPEELDGTLVGGAAARANG